MTVAVEKIEVRIAVTPVNVSLQKITLITGQSLAFYAPNGDLIGVMDQSGNFAIRGNFGKLG